ncbi:MAG: methyltransferase domain-containing protein [Anaerolineae bacterium]|nr:class I SAM-dependent methyltransferase [Anaerolineae bacterium]MDW8298572.1 methyltransferase domain-containing protein [Anaerolineae bacterium]
MQFPREYFQRYDESPDELFYSAPRLVVHIDDGAIAAVTQLYSELLPETGHVLDLMSSWRSHLPSSFKGKVSALGMNAEEMRQNPQVDEFVVQNLNRTPRLPYADQTFDGAVCTVSVQYLIDPVTVFKDVRRVLKPEAPFIITFSNRCFPTKAVAIWQVTNMAQKAALVASYLEAAGFAEIRAEDRSPQARRSLFGMSSGDPLVGVWGRRPRSDL